MENKLNIRKAVISIALTFLLGPGAGHIYLGKFKKGLALIAAALFTGVLLFIGAVKSGAGVEAIAQNPTAFMYDYQCAHPGTMLVYDIVFAGIWAYAFVDAFFKSQPEDLFERKNAL